MIKIIYNYIASREHGGLVEMMVLALVVSVVEVCVTVVQLHVQSLVRSTCKDIAFKLVLPLAGGLDGRNTSYCSDVTQTVAFLLSTFLYYHKFLFLLVVVPCKLISLVFFHFRQLYICLGVH